MAMQMFYNLSAIHPVFCEDEVDINLHPKIGADWQLCGQQKYIVTPGQNEKYYLAGALHSSTSIVSYMGGSVFIFDSVFYEMS